MWCEIFIKLLAQIGYEAAIMASGTASNFGCYQPKEPEALRKLKK